MRQWLSGKKRRRRQAAEIGVQSTVCNREQFSKLTNFEKDRLDFQDFGTAILT
jgi:hypothetical protein